jgi:hypothetical protein
MSPKRPWSQTGKLVADVLFAIFGKELLKVADLHHFPADMLAKLSIEPKDVPLALGVLLEGDVVSVLLTPMKFPVIEQALAANEVYAIVDRTTMLHYDGAAMPNGVFFTLSVGVTRPSGDLN